MRSPRLCTSLVIAALVACLVLVPVPLSAQQPDLRREWLARVNQLRLDEGLAPYSNFSLLNDAAQRHAEDLAANALSSTTGSTGSTPGHRIDLVDDGVDGIDSWSPDRGRGLCRLDSR